MDASKSKATDVTPETIAKWVSSKIPSPRDSTAVRFVEILYTNGQGDAVKVTLRLDGDRFVIDTIGGW